MATERRYWDTACFLAIVGKEPGRVEVCAPILRAATKRTLDIEIVTSAFTITEVLYPKGGTPLSPEKRELIKRFFRNPGIVLVVVDRDIAESAQEQFWDHGVRPKDAVHVASALAAKVPVLETYDEKLLKLSGKLGDGTLIVREPVPVFGTTRRAPEEAPATLFDPPPGVSGEREELSTASAGTEAGDAESGPPVGGSDDKGDSDAAAAEGADGAEALPPGTEAAVAADEGNGKTPEPSAAPLVQPNEDPPPAPPAPALPTPETEQPARGA